MAKLLARMTVVGLLATLGASAQTNLPSSSLQLAVSNILSRLTNDAAKAAFRARLDAEFPKQVELPLDEVIGWSTNKAAVFSAKRTGTKRVNTNPFFVELARVGYPVNSLTQRVYSTNFEFRYFLPKSLNNLTWTNFIAHTNGRTVLIWSVKNYLRGWPSTPPVIRWNTNSIMWGMRGLTAISPSWQGEGGPGQVPITALTRRHGYTRGHGIALDGFGKLFPGMKIWFLTLDNKLVETKVLRTVVRTAPVSGNDYTIILFSSDLPESIEPIRVVADQTRLAKYPVIAGAPALVYMTEQNGNVSAGVSGFTVETTKGGDSGSPNMIPLPGELVFYAGRTTSGPSAAMQADMDELCRLSNLDPAKYQMQWVDLSAFPSY